MKTRARPLRPLLLLCGALLGATLAPLPLGAQKMASEADETAAEAQDPDSEGIEVHGHWVIEVRDPDGSLVERRAFENELSPMGDEILSALLSGEEAADAWAVTFGDIGEGGPCGTTSCATHEPDFTYPSPSGAAENLVVERVDGIFRLSGSETMDEDGTINQVMTNVGRCDVTVTPCDPIGTSMFTGTVLDSPVDVSAGQSVSVTVEISFTSG